VSLHAPGNAETRHQMDRRRLAILTPHVAGVLSFAFMLMLREMKGRKLIQGFIFLPHIVSGVALAAFWDFLLNHDGMLNKGLHSFGAGPVDWLKPQWQFNAILIAIVWINTGYYVTILMAGVDRGGFGPAFVNSVVVVVVAAAGTVLLASPAAYVLGRNQNRVSGGVSMYFVLGLGIPMQIIVLPLAKGGLMTALTLVAIACWNETFLALMFLQTNDNFTLPLALVNFLTQQQFTGEDFGVMFAGVSIAVLPMLALYAWLGRRITEGLTLGAGK
jgi:ABC-type glycerol-3-phosphate transport system permease component